MTRTTVVVIGMVAALGSLAADARAQGGRTLNVGGTTVVLARAGGGYRGVQTPRVASVPQFRALSGETRTTLLRTGQETLVAAAPGAALNRVTELTGGVTLLTARPTRTVAAEVGARGSLPPFAPLAADRKAAILEAAAAAEPAAPAAPAQPVAESPFTLTPLAMNAPSRAYVYISEPQFMGGQFNFASFNNGKGFVKVATAGVTARQYMLHFQVFNPNRATYDYKILTGDGTVMTVSARASGTQDIVLMLMLPSANPGYGTTLADISAPTRKPA